MGSCYCPEVSDFILTTCVCVCAYQHVSIQRTSLRCLIHNKAKRENNFIGTHIFKAFIHIALLLNKTMPNLHYIHQYSDQKL